VRSDRYRKRGSDRDKRDYRGLAFILARVIAKAAEGDFRVPEGLAGRRSWAFSKLFSSTRGRFVSNALGFERTLLVERDDAR